MGSFVLDDPCCIQYYNGQPLSVALTQSCSDAYRGHSNLDLSACCDSDFALVQQPQQICSGRRYRRECFTNYRPLTYYNSCWNLPPPPPPPPAMVPWGAAQRCGFRDNFFNNFETVEFEERRCRPVQCVVKCCHPPKPIVRQLKVRPRPSSCADIRCDDGRRIQCEININCHKPPTPVQPVVQPPIDIVIPPIPVEPKPPRRPLAISDTERFDLYEEQGKVKCQVKTETIEHAHTVSEPVQRIYEYVNICGHQQHQDSKIIKSEEVVSGTSGAASHEFSKVAPCGPNCKRLLHGSSSGQSSNMVLSGSSLCRNTIPPESYLGQNSHIIRPEPFSGQNSNMVSSGSSFSQNSHVIRSEPFSGQRSNVVLSGSSSCGNIVGSTRENGSDYFSSTSTQPFVVHGNPRNTTPHY